MAGFKGFRGRLDMKGYTSIPNEFFDEVLPQIKSLSELKVILALFRKTYGWVSHVDPNTGEVMYKEQDRVSMSQFMELTGLSKPSCVDGVKRALEHGYIERVSEGRFGGYVGENEAAEYRISQYDEHKEPSTPPSYQDIGGESNKDPAVEFSEELSETWKKKLDKEIKDVLDTDKDMSFNDDSDIQTTLEEFFPSSTKEEEPPKKKKGGKSFKDLPIEKWNANHLLAFFRDEFYKTLGFAAPPITNKDRGQMKKLMEAYDQETIAHAIRFYLQNYKNISYLPPGFPNFSVFYGYSKSLIPQSINPSAAKQGKINLREYEPEQTRKNDDDSGGKYVW